MFYYHHLVYKPKLPPGEYLWVVISNMGEATPMLKICPGKFHNFVERFKNQLKTYINDDKTLLPLSVDKAVQIVSTLVQYMK